MICNTACAISNHIFKLVGKWFNVVKVRNLRGEHTGYYCGITARPKLLEDGSVEITDLFLDLWVSPDLRYRVLDQDELEEALKETKYHVAVAKTLKEDEELLKSGFEYVTDRDGVKIYRKRR